MSKKIHNPDFAADAEIDTFRYRGPDRREPDHGEAEKLEVDVRFDAKGNPVWEMRTTLPRRHKDDDTLDLLKCLTVDSLEIVDDENAGTDADEGPSRSAGYDPYARTKR